MQHKPQTFQLTLPESSRPRSLLDLIPLEELQQLQDMFAEIHGVASVITDPQGNPLTLTSNEISVCRLIRKSSQGFSRCMEAARSVSAEIAGSAPKVCQPCESLGILKTAVPIVIDNLHLANWWVSQYCNTHPPAEALRSYAEQVGLRSESLMEELERGPKGEKSDFFKKLAWIDELTHRIAGLIYQNRKLSQSLDDIHQLESELDQHRAQMENLIEERTAELIKANNRLQLEVLERDLAEEQIERKSKLLKAVNHILQQTLIDQSDQALADTFLETARSLTSSAFGFVAEQRQGRWTVTAIHHPDQRPEADTAAPKPREFEISHIWRRLREKDQPLMLANELQKIPWHPLPRCRPDVKSLLAVALSKNQQVSGFVAVADNPDGYALIDQFDMEIMAQAFTETLLRKRMEKAKTISEKRLNLALDSANEGLWDYAPLSEEVYYSPRWFAMLGYSAGEFPDTMETWHTLTHPEDLPVLEGTFDMLLRREKEFFSIEVRMLNRSGQWAWLQVRGRTVEHNEENQVRRIVGTLSDISKFKQVETALQKANEELQRLAALDDLTQVANRRRFDDRLGQEWRRAQRDQKHVAVIICDIDYFKNYNDTYGHLKGDHALYTVAQAINDALKRPMDMLARYGGEEFAIILPGTHVKGAERVAKELKEAVEALALEHKSSAVSPHITLSFGVAAMVPSPELSLKALIETADRALYRAKGMGRNRIVSLGTGSEADEPPDKKIAPPSEPVLDGSED
jgi:diguanylate cyclase (GGDEF)-like protein/PAS domain S-box-containing protein